MKKLKVIVGIDKSKLIKSKLIKSKLIKSKLIKSNKRIVACGKNFETVLNPSFDTKRIVVECI